MKKWLSTRDKHFLWDCAGYNHSDLIGSGIASLAGAAYLIRDAGVNGDDIVLFEETQEPGGALDAHGDATSGFFMSGSRMFESKYNSLYVKPHWMVCEP